MTKSPRAVAKEALRLAQESLPAYSSKFSRKDFTQHQHFALMALREFLKVEYRGLEQILGEWAELREVLGLEKVPDHSTMLRARRSPNQKREFRMRVLTHNLMLLAAA